jgi:hypothetical protein
MEIPPQQKPEASRDRSVSSFMPGFAFHWIKYLREPRRTWDISDLFPVCGIMAGSPRKGPYWIGRGRLRTFEHAGE